MHSMALWDNLAHLLKHCCGRGFHWSIEWISFPLSVAPTTSLLLIEPNTQYYLHLTHIATNDPKTWVSTPFWPGLVLIPIFWPWLNQLFTRWFWRCTKTKASTRTWMLLEKFSLRRRQTILRLSNVSLTFLSITRSPKDQKYVYLLVVWFPKTKRRRLRMRLNCPIVSMPTMSITIWMSLNTFVIH